MRISAHLCCLQDQVAKVRRALARKRLTRFHLYLLFEQYVIEYGAHKTLTSSGELTIDDVKANSWVYCGQLAVELAKQGISKVVGAEVLLCEQVRLLAGGV